MRMRMTKNFFSLPNPLIFFETITLEYKIKRTAKCVSFGIGAFENWEA